MTNRVSAYVDFVKSFYVALKELCHEIQPN